MAADPAADNYLRTMAAKYIWWKKPDVATQQPQRVTAQVMNLGDFADAQQLADIVGDDYLKAVIKNAEPGWFNERSWYYWHYRLGLAKLDNVPALPLRIVA